MRLLGGGEGGHGVHVSGAHRLEGVAVDVGGDGDRAVAEGVGDVLERDAGVGKQAGGGLAQLVRGHVSDAGRLGDAGQGAAHIGRVQWSAGVGGEHQQQRVRPVAAGSAPVLVLQGLLLPEGTVPVPAVRSRLGAWLS